MFRRFGLRIDGDEQRKLKAKEHVRVIRDRDGAVLLDTKQGVYFSLNTLGSEIWSQLEQARGFGEIFQNLQSAYAVPKSKLKRDLIGFLNVLAKRRLIHVYS